MKKFYKILKQGAVLGSILSVINLCSGCTYQAVPSQYDLKIKSNEKEIVCDEGNDSFEITVSIDSYRYHDLTSDENVFLSYHVLNEDGTMNTFDNERSILIPIAARGKGNEIMKGTAPSNAGKYLIQIDLVEENVTWFSEKGMPTVQIPLTVKSSAEQ